MLSGFLIGVTNPDNAGVAGQQFGKAAALPLLLISAGVSGLLTKLGKLPGSKKN
jgi:hypothetical protein